MSLIQDIQALKAEISGLPEVERLGYFKCWIKGYPDQSKKEEILTLWDIVNQYGLVDYPNQARQIVILLHGIRTEATWQSLIAQELRGLPNIEVFPIGYGWFDAVRFWSPKFLGLRKFPEQKITREIRNIRSDHQGGDIVVVAHSFSTYLIGQILAEHTDIRIRKLILCGSIIPTEYRWDRVKTGKDGIAIVNDVGTRDLWPVMARIGSWGYGPSGTFGFKTSQIRDRYFNYSHSDFFSPDHVRKYWIPFIVDGRIVDSKWDVDRASSSAVLGFLAHVPFVKIVIPLVAIGAWLLARFLLSLI